MGKTVGQKFGVTDPLKQSAKVKFYAEKTNKSGGCLHGSVLEPLKNSIMATVCSMKE
jgi:hypothetical protein